MPLLDGIVSADVSLPLPLALSYLIIARFCVFIFIFLFKSILIQSVAIACKPMSFVWHDAAARCEVNVQAIVSGVILPHSANTWRQSGPRRAGVKRACERPS